MASVLSNKSDEEYVSTSFDQQFQVSQGHTSYKKKENRKTEVHGGGGLELVKPAREPAFSRPKPCASLKKPHESCPFAAPCGPRRKKNDRGQRSAFPSETSRFALSILAHRGSALRWLVNDRAALRLRHIATTACQLTTNNQRWYTSYYYIIQPFYSRSKSCMVSHTN